MNNANKKKFYDSQTWKSCRKLVLIRDNYLCQLCIKQNKLTLADIVHHIEHLEDNPNLALDIDNLLSVCSSCHNKEHPEKGKKKEQGKKSRRIKVIEVKANNEVT
ncbi:HNH endonuclease [Chengkuizengella marina]|uniref:Putative HNH nuclease YajD n=1 Tax=Chengkuizengella marina TaxID=2507566 RepID=A0A6N9Q977_9BACL|nr:HNH endonuclease signature motif containing protein [Chengkuizengella marina]NBI31241.1 HNH endonuclease [Chengkuizengella marina]